MTTIGVPKEANASCHRVALMPEIIEKFIHSRQIDVRVESSAGDEALTKGIAFEEAGAEITDRETVFESDIVTVVEAPKMEDVEQMSDDQVLVGLLSPRSRSEAIEAYAKRGIRAISMELIPRISRAQSMDVLSAMGSLAGYRAAVEATEALPKFFPLLTTAAGTIRPADVLVLGAGVAGLQAIATAKRLGARVKGYDIREATRQEVQSLGAEFLEIGLETGGAESEEGYAREQDDEFKEKQPELLAPHIGDADVVITTAQIPGRPAPTLVTEEAVERMDPASVIVDLAAPSGGNCVLTEPGKQIRYPDTASGVEIRGPLNMPDRMPQQASQLYSKCVSSMLETILDEEGQISIDLEDDIIDSTLVCADGEMRD